MPKYCLIELPSKKYIIVLFIIYYYGLFYNFIIQLAFNKLDIGI
jgi:hypothetical protein